DQIIISEVLPNPEGSDTEGEFIELYNTGQVSVDLIGWQLGDASSRVYTIAADDLPPKTITGQAYLAIFRPISGIALNNSGDQVVLYHPNQQITDQVEYGNSFEGQSYALIENDWKWTATVTPGEVNSFQVQNEPPEAKLEINSKEGKVRQTISLSAQDSTDPDGDELTYAWQLGNGETLTGKEVEYQYQNEGEYQIVLTATDNLGATDQDSVVITITDYDYSTDIWINELLPNPEDNDKTQEWIELFNSGSDQVDLAGWKLTDEKTDYIFSDNSIIEAKGYLVIWRPDSKIGLNNSGDTIFLVDPANQVVNGVEYGSAKAGLSFARVDDSNWRWTDSPTDGEVNQFTLEEEGEGEQTQLGDKGAMEVSLDQVADLESGDLVKTAGVVTVEPGILAKNIYFISDQITGAQIYCSGDCAEVEVGEEIKISGKISVSQGFNRIKVTKEETNIIGHREITAKEISAADLANNINNLVNISGQVSSLEGSRIFITDEGGEQAIVYLKRSTGLKKSMFEESQQVVITGIVEATKEEVRLLPRYQEDIETIGQVLGEEVEPEEVTKTEAANQLDLSQPKKESNKVPYFILLGILLAGGVGYYFWQRKKQD
ncbi:lamin tail domain-containing protein, partial [Patescibacteria group bacterium]|nr:lamin tail domain-containing protein [Patescibacteria group bacterium]